MIVLIKLSAARGRLSDHLSKGFKVTGIIEDNRIIKYRSRGYIAGMGKNMEKS